MTLHPHLGYAAAIHVDHHAAHVMLVDAAGATRAEAHGGFRTNDDRVECIAALVAECVLHIAGGQNHAEGGTARTAAGPGRTAAGPAHTAAAPARTAAGQPSGAAAQTPTAGPAHRAAGPARAAASPARAAAGPAHSTEVAAPTSAGAVHIAVVAVPGAVTPDGALRNDEGPDGGGFRHALSAALGCPVRLENDVNLAALAELAEPTAADLRSFALLMLVDDALGAGIVIDGKLHRGASGIAGEVMYLPQTPLPVGAPVVSDVVVSDLALIHGRDPKALLRDHLSAAADGDEAALQIIAEIARRLVLLSGTIALVLDPEAFVLGGDAAHPVLVEAVVRTAEQFSALLTVQYLVAAHAHDAPLIGAVREASSALRALLFPRILAP